MRKREEIMDDANGKENFDSYQDKHTWLIVELLCDIRDDQIAHNNEIERLIRNRGI